jgi:hypothetical protein
LYLRVVFISLNEWTEKMPHKPGHKNVSKSVGKLLKKAAGLSGATFGKKRLVKAARKVRALGGRMGKSPTQAGQRFFGDVDAGKSKQDSIGHQQAALHRLLSGAQVTNAELEKFDGGGAAMGAKFTNAEKRRMLEQMRDRSGGQVTSAVLKRYLRGQK